MIVIIGNKEAVCHAAQKRNIPVIPEKIAANDESKPFTRRRLSDLRYGELLGVTNDESDQALVVAQRDNSSFTLILADYEDTEISFNHEPYPASLKVADLVGALSAFIPHRPWVGHHMDIRA